ncbi:hypothetical protein PMI35_00701 [Pseudomonas sp. GM78]|uniref:hypothetical protein n=1 Tax=Pseudomonas sp. GM78 TaxID=1144337 RepID=UPI00026F9776|nr:hypothetical protein [Pseudomonas sp. GM78]EJN33826.1 hypothetical protein PMI35_00701 [Pseudomonas sp. GM78]
MGSPLPASFCGHGTYIYDVPSTIKRFSDVQGVVSTLQSMDMSHAWVRVHGTSAYSASSKKLIGTLIDALQTEGIAVAGWGWNQGVSPATESRLAIKELQFFGLNDYVADIEHGHNNSSWTAAEIADYCRRVREAVTGGFGVTTFSLIDWHEPQLMRAALPFVDMFNPQVYWFNFPNAKMLKQFKRSNGTPYESASPSAYAELCLDGWVKLMGATPRPIVMTGQSYWGEAGFSKEEADRKLDKFLASFSAFARVAGLNWWHAGGSSAMSTHMLDAIKAAGLGGKTFQS